jgi:CubicO group peptidase (beta-lactamase class C family)
MKSLIAILVTSCLAASAVGQQTESAVKLYFPGSAGDASRWETVSAVSLGLDVDALDAAVDFAMDRKSSSVVVLVGGRLLVERHQKVQSPTLRYQSMVKGKDADGHAIEDVASVQKSVVSMLMGIAIENNLVKLDEPVHKHLGRGWSQASPKQEEQITLRHLVTMTSGLSEQLKFIAPADTKWAYNTTAYSRSFDAIAAAAKMSHNELTTAWLTTSLGMTNSKWIERRGAANSDVPANHFGFATTARDLARFGLMVLALGKWHQQTIIGDQQYIKAATSPSQELNPSYGYLWWLNGQKSPRKGLQKAATSLIPSAPKDLFAAQGALGRKCYVVPSKQIVITRLGDDPEIKGQPKFNDEFWRLLRLAATARR